jgi:hypothetical protein
VTVPVLAVNTAQGRGYRHPLTRQVVPSVTTCLGAVPKPQLVDAAGRVAGEYAASNWGQLSCLTPGQRQYRIATAHKKKWAAKADLGTAIHAACEAWAAGQPFPRDPDAEPYLDQLTEFLFDLRPVFIENEVTVWSKKHEYAGTADAIIQVKDQLMMIDWKTGAKFHAENALQLAALANADVILRPDGTEDPIPGITELAVVQLHPDSWAMARVRRVTDCFAAFLACRDVIRWQAEVADDVLELT